MRDSDSPNRSARNPASRPTVSPKAPEEAAATAAMDVAIFGAGIAGLVSAIAVRRAVTTPQ